MQLKRIAAGLAASVTLLGTGVVTGVLAAPLFKDVPPSHWAYNSVTWASTNGIMNGPDSMSGYFDPAGVANRAQLATVLARYDEMIREHIDALDMRVDRLESSKSSSSMSSSSMMSSSSKSSSSSSMSSSSMSSSSMSSSSSLMSSSSSLSSMSSSSMSSSSMSSSSMSSSSSSL